MHIIKVNLASNLLQFFFCSVSYQVDVCSIMQDTCKQVFEAAHKGDAATVQSLLLRHSFSPDLTNTVSNVIINFVVLYHYTT